MFSIFTDELKACILCAKEEMDKLCHSYIGTEHFLLAVLNGNYKLKKILNEHGITYEIFKQSIVELIGYGNEKEKLFVYTPMFKKVLENSISLSNELNMNVTIENVFLSILEEAEGVAYRILCEYDADLDSICDEIDTNLDRVISKSKYINEFGIDLCEKAANNKLDPVIGRDNEVNRMIEIICRKNKRNPLLIGEAGVGKTSIVEELARRIAYNEVPFQLQNKKVISLSMASLVSGTKYRGEFEEKVLKLFNEIEQNNNIIVFIDEIHTLVGAGGADGAIDASNILKPALARGNIIVIGATTTNEYNKYIEEDKALSRRFQTIIVDEPNEVELLNILQKTKINYEKYHNVIINNEIIKYIIEMSKRYLPYRQEPDKSIDILDEAAAKTSILKSECIKEKELLVNKLNEIKKQKMESVLNNDFSFLINCRRKERKLISKINKIDILLTTNNERKIVTKEIINEVIKTRTNIPVYTKNMLKSVLKTLKSELLNDFYTEKDIVNQLVDYTRKIFNKNEYKKPSTILFIGDKNTQKLQMAKKYGEIIFKNKIIDLDLSTYYSSNKLLNGKSILKSIKEYPFSILLISNYNNAVYEIRDIIDRIISTGKIETENNEVLFFNNALLLFIDDNYKQTIGFNNKQNNIYKDVDTVINFEVLVSQ